MLYGTITALVTPMDDNNNIDFDSLNQLIEHQIANKVSGIVIGGSTGEAIALTNDEKIAILNHVIKQVNRRIHVIAAIIEGSTYLALQLVELFNQIHGIDCIMASVPYCVKPPQDGIYQYFTALADASRVPILLYNVPSRTSSDMDNQTVLALAQHHNIIGLKDATGDICRLNYLNKNKPTDFVLLSGDDHTTLAFLLCGGNGVISVVSNVFPDQFNQMVTAAINKDVENAIKLNDRLLDFYDFLFSQTNPILSKWCMHILGLIKHPNLRLPLTLPREPSTTTSALNYINQIRNV